MSLSAGSGRLRLPRRMRWDAVRVLAACRRRDDESVRPGNIPLGLLELGVESPQVMLEIAVRLPVILRSLRTLLPEPRGFGDADPKVQHPEAKVQHAIAQLLLFAGCREVIPNALLKFLHAGLLWAKVESQLS
ncbi:hypothetical protein C4552_00875 [Candidatus Parcubacteria bacterium]|nr:MAG: hypothetical protein C4552_00875 [Candidatus Parcubacteria bacterium]